MSWISLTLGTDAFLLFAYTDRMAGPSGKGAKLAGPQPTHEEATRAVQQPDSTVRLGGMQPYPLSAEWIAYLQLPAKPPWMVHFEAPVGAGAAMPATPWRDDPMLRGAFHPGHPDDLEVTFVQFSKQTLEKMWVRLGEVVPQIGYRGTLLNTSHVDPAQREGTRVLVRPSRSHPPALWVPDGACADNLRTHESQCEQCGFELIFIPVAELTRLQFPAMPPGSLLEFMTTRCLMCRGTMDVKLRK